MTDNNILYIGPPGTGKTYTALQEAEKCKDYQLISFHPGYSYQDFIKGIAITTEDDKINYESAEKIFINFCNKAGDPNNSGNSYALILDDIQRADFSGIFGELMYAIEYRGQEIKLSEGNASIIVPENLKIFATMSTAGGKGQIDYALLRRFKVHYMFSSEKMLEDALNKNVSDKSTREAIINIYKDINDFIRNPKHKHISDDKLEEYALGYTYFLPESDKGFVTNVKQKVLHQIIPMLEQYRKDGIIDFTNDEKDQLLKKYTQTYVTDYNEVDRDMSIEWCTPNGKELGKAIKNPGEIKIYSISNGPTDTVKCKSVFDYVKVFLERYKEPYLKYKYSETYQFINCKFSFSNHYSYAELINTIVFFLLELKLIDNTSFYNEIMKNIKLKGPISKEPNRTGITQKISLYNSSNEGYNGVKPIRNVKDYSYFLINKKSSNIEYVVSIGSHINESFTTNSNYTLDNGSKRYPDVIRIIEAYYSYYKKIYKEHFSQSIEENNKEYEKFCSAFTDLFKNYKNNSSIMPSDFIDMLIFFCEKLHEAVKKSNVKGIYKIMDTSYFDIMNNLNIHQMILQGPPGTSKTFGAKEFIKERINAKEGIEVSDDELNAHQLKYNESNTGKQVYWDIVQFHPSYSYEDFVRGIEVSTKNETIKYDTVDKILGKIAAEAAEDRNKENEYYLIIDEINRANMATVFGELIYALEYRGKKVSTPYTVGNTSSIKIPSNLYIIGTMNTADKSIGGMDYAIRRRFLFFPTLPDKNVVLKNAEKYFNPNPDDNNKYNADDALNVKLFDAVEGIFDNYLESDYHKDDVQIGHTYFLANTDDKTQDKDTALKDLMYNRLKYQILPILREYYKDGILRPVEKQIKTEEGLTSKNIYYYAVYYNEFNEEKFDTMVGNPDKNTQEEKKES